MANASNGLALDLFKRVSDQYNVFIAPFSISTVLAMTYQGAAGRSAEELARVMGEFQTRPYRIFLTALPRGWREVNSQSMSFSAGYSHTKELRQSILDGFKSARALISQETGQNDLIDLNMMQVDARLKILPEMKQRLMNYFGTNIDEVSGTFATLLVGTSHSENPEAPFGWSVFTATSLQ